MYEVSSQSILNIKRYIILANKYLVLVTVRGSENSWIICDYVTNILLSKCVFNSINN